MGPSKRRAARRTYSLIIIATVIFGVIAAGFTYFQFLAPPDCGPTPSPRYSVVHQATHNGIEFLAINATFTEPGQAAVIGGITFRTSYFFNPAIPHLVGRECVTDTNAPVTLFLDTTFYPSGLEDRLEIQYGGNPPVGYQEEFTAFSGSQAGVKWYPGDLHVVLLARSS